jgi:hypothetical protein
MDVFQMDKLGFKYFYFMKEKMKLLIISSLVGSLFYLLIGWLVFDFLLGAYTEAHTTQIEGFKKEETFSFLFLYLSCLAYALLISFVHLHIAFKSAILAFSFSAIFGILVACMTDFFWFASSNFYLNQTVMLLDIVAAGVCVGALGWVIFMIQKNRK